MTKCTGCGKAIAKGQEAGQNADFCLPCFKCFVCGCGPQQLGQGYAVMRCGPNKLQRQPHCASCSAEARQQRVNETTGHIKGPGHGQRKKGYFASANNKVALDYSKAMKGQDPLIGVGLRPEGAVQYIGKAPEPTTGSRICPKCDQRGPGGKFCGQCGHAFQNFRTG